MKAAPVRGSGIHRKSPEVGSLLAGAMVEAFRDVLPNGPTRFLAVPGVGPTWAAAKADGEMREKALRDGAMAHALTHVP